MSSTPSLASSSTAIAAAGPPIPVDIDITYSPSMYPPYVVYSLWDGDPLGVLEVLRYARDPVRIPWEDRDPSDVLFPQPGVIESSLRVPGLKRQPAILLRPALRPVI